MSLFRFPQKLTLRQILKWKSFIWNVARAGGGYKIPVEKMKEREPTKNSFSNQHPLRDTALSTHSTSGEQYRIQEKGKVRKLGW